MCGYTQLRRKAVRYTPQQMPGGSSMKRQRPAGADLATFVDEALLEHFSPAAVIVTKSLAVLETRGDLTPFPVQASAGGTLRGVAARFCSAENVTSVPGVPDGNEVMCSQGVWVLAE